jgi:uncharacterized protein YecE (DUF72 family)
MARLLVGLPALQGDLGKYAGRFDLVEVRAMEGGGTVHRGVASPPPGLFPRAATLRKWRKSVPPAFVFSVVLPRVVGELVPGDALDGAVAEALEAAAALEARCVVLQTPPSVRPTTTNKKRLAAVFEKIPREGTVRCWEPAGIWEREEALLLGRALSVLVVLDATRDVPGPGPIVYTRLRALGKTASLGAQTMERVAERLRRRRETFVVVEGSAAEAQRVKQALAADLASRPARAVGVTTVRPAISTLVAEDEEQ